MPIRSIKRDYSPVFGIPESMMPEIGSIMYGEKIKGIISFEVIEKTKSYMILRIGHLHIMKMKRMA